MQTWKHLPVPLDHRIDDSAPEVLELVLFHLQARPHLTQRRLTHFLWQESHIPTEHTNLKRTIYPVDRTVGVID